MSEQTIILPPNPAGAGHDAGYRLTVMVPKRRYSSYLRDRWWVVMLCMMLTLSAMLTYETIRSDTYSSHAQLYLIGEVQLDMSSLFNEESMNYFGTQIELLKSARIQGAAMEKAGVFGNASGKKDEEMDEKKLIKLDVTQPMRTSVLLLQATGPDPVQVQRFLEALIDGYMDFKKETRISTSEGMVLLMSQQLEKREKSLQAEQDKWTEFQKTNNTAALEEDAKSAGLYLSELNLQAAKLKLDCQFLRASAAIPQAVAVSTNSASPGLMLTNVALTNVVMTNITVAGDAALKQAKAELEVLQGELAEKAKVLNERHPVVVKLTEDVAHYEKVVRVLEDQNRDQRQMELSDLEKRVEAVENAIPVWERRVLEINDRLSQSLRLKNNVMREQAAYDRISSMLQNVDLKRNVQQERLSLVQAPTPGQLTKRYLAIRIVVATFAGFALSLGIVFGWYLLDDRFVSVRDVKDQFGERVLGLVPQIRVSRSKPRDILLQETDTRAAYAESYRHLRSALLLSSGTENQSQTILVTGATIGEGASSVALNLSMALARSGRKVVLVDADLRDGGIHELLDQPETPGMTECLRKIADNCAVIRPTTVSGLSFVSKGSVGGDSDGLFLHPELGSLICALRQDRDFVILNSAPILASGDAALLVPHVDQLILVTGPYHTRSRQIREALEMLYQGQVKEVSFIFNRARGEDMESQYSRKAPRAVRKASVVLPERIT